MRKTTKVGLGKSFDICGDRYPLISIHKDVKLGLHITSCVNGDKNYGWTSNNDGNFPETGGLVKGKWYKIDIGQEYRSGTANQEAGYYWYLDINGWRARDTLNLNATSFDNMQAFASNPWNDNAVDTKIRNFIIQTEQDDVDGSGELSDVSYSLKVTDSRI